MKYVKPVEVYSALRDDVFGADRLLVEQFVDGSLLIAQQDLDAEDGDHWDRVTMSAAHFEAIAAALGYVRGAVEA